MTVPSFNAAFSAIAGLTITGMTNIYTLANAPDAVFGRDCPALLPQGVTSGADNRLSFGAAGGAFYVAEFTIDYYFLYSEVGAMRKNSDVISAAEDLLALAIAAIRNTDTTISGTAEIVWNSRGLMATVNDYSGRQFVGCPVSFRVTQYYNL